MCAARTLLTRLHRGWTTTSTGSSQAGAHRVVEPMTALVTSVTQQVGCWHVTKVHTLCHMERMVQTGWFCDSNSCSKIVWTILCHSFLQTNHVILSL